MTTIEDLSQYADKHVTVTYRDGGEHKTITGLVIRAHDKAMLVRPKGRAFELIDVEDINSIEVIHAPAPRIKMRSMEQVTAEHVRQHLADRHGVDLPSIPDDPEKAFELHEQINHRLLGHQHRPDADEVVERAAALEAVADDVLAEDGVEDYDEED